MRHVVSASLFALACALAQPASAQLEDKPVPMDKAPFHIPAHRADAVPQHLLHPEESRTGRNHGVGPLGC